MGTTKLTRKEILSDDPVRENIIRLAGFLQANRAKIGVAVIIVVLLAFGFWALSGYRAGRADAAGAMLGRGMEFFSANISPEAEDDLYAQSETPLFKNEEEKYKAAEKEFSAAADSFSSGEAGKTARYYLGLTQLQLGKKEESQKNLESVAFGSGNRTVGFLAKKALAGLYADSGNIKGAEDLLRGMIKDTGCDLPKEEIGMQLAGILATVGKKDEAIGVLREVSDASTIFGVYNQQLLAEIERLQKDVPVTETPVGEP